MTQKKSVNKKKKKTIYNSITGERKNNETLGIEIVSFARVARIILVDYP